jgi:hypothetical protein
MSASSSDDSVPSDWDGREPECLLFGAEPTSAPGRRAVIENTTLDDPLTVERLALLARKGLLASLATGVRRLTA